LTACATPLSPTPGSTQVRLRIQSYMRHGQLWRAPGALRTHPSRRRTPGSGKEMALSAGRGLRTASVGTMTYTPRHAPARRWYDSISSASGLSGVTLAHNVSPPQSAIATAPRVQDQPRSVSLRSKGMLPCRPPLGTICTPRPQTILQASSPTGPIAKASGAHVCPL